MIKKWFVYTFYIFSLGILLRVFLLDFYPDFSVYYSAVKVALSGGNPYSNDLSLFAPFMYPPQILFIFIPFLYIPYIVAEKLWLFMSFVFLFLSLIFLFKINKQKLLTPQSIFLCSLVFLSFPLKFTLGMGQINVMILLFSVLFIYFLHKDKDYIAGILLGLSISLKLFPVLLLPYLLLIRKWKILLSALTTLITITVLTLFAFGHEMLLEFWYKVLPALGSPWDGGYYNQALSGTITKLTGSPNQLFQFIVSSILIIISAWVILSKKKKTHSMISMDIGMIITLSLLINNFSWQHHFVWLLIPFLTIFYYLKKNKYQWHYYVLLGISSFLVSINLRFPSLYPPLIKSHVFFGAFILWFINIYLLLKAASNKQL
ncbi:hypothetical protein A2773_01880 [Candidatus Gottesmanbacteria bacterium RIFCSPHIGHO2_01_FULL_39_10]|uniref:DUF2029 domain-containing protein n=1 Tax=Candidatus Gottesmanbacteria bacterium RIFCSPHIGHO2_01_FULL_39_10 TaxID=1798375 RepID=A0A1F5ZLG6_9BACT|nr:MAG: hypothetical protein A2773_01880 [Candidatus Gottesmanbacteria bacterium RIFCSPHIGHO2_01_FULL_39_10]